MKIVFLDIDGVLNSLLTRAPSRLDPENIAILNQFTRATGASLVISSTWRLVHPLPDLRRILADAGVEAPVVGRTPRLLHHGLLRGEEIQCWLDCQVEPTSHFAVLDDDSDMGPVQGHLVHLTDDVGFREHHLPMALALLGTPSADR